MSVGARAPTRWCAAAKRGKPRSRNGGVARCARVPLRVRGRASRTWGCSRPVWLCKESGSDKLSFAQAEAAAVPPQPLVQWVHGGASREATHPRRRDEHIGKGGAFAGASDGVHGPQSSRPRGPLAAQRAPPRRRRDAGASSATVGGPTLGSRWDAATASQLRPISLALRRGSAARWEQGLVGGDQTAGTDCKTSRRLACCLRRANKTCCAALALETPDPKRSFRSQPLNLFQDPSAHDNMSRLGTTRHLKMLTRATSTVSSYYKIHESLLRPHCTSTSRVPSSLPPSTSTPNRKWNGGRPTRPVKLAHPHLQKGHSAGDTGGGFESHMLGKRKGRGGGDGRGG